MKLHELLRAGIDALKEFEQRDNCVVDMAKWTEPSQSGLLTAPCFACLGGAYYIKSTGIDIGDSQLDIYKRVITEEEDILNHLRTGNVTTALYRKSGGLEEPVNTRLDRTVADYHEDRDQFYEDMETLYTDLVNAGL